MQVRGVRQQTERPGAGPRGAVDLYWIPLGAGGVVVKWNGRVYETLCALVERRRPRALYHCALQVRVNEGRYSIELTPVPAASAPHGVVGGGAVGSRWLGRFRLFRYELRCWHDGVIPDLSYAVGGAQRLTTDPDVARRVLAATAAVPTAVWGRDELRAGEMWNSNSVIAWLLATSGAPLDAARPPAGGRAPGWNAGLVVARRQRFPAPRSSYAAPLLHGRRVTTRTGG